MESIFEDTNRRVINKTEDINFNVSSAGIYIIQIAARATNTEILKIKIDQKEYFNKPAVFSGGELKGLKKSVFWVLSLNPGSHTVSLVPQPAGTLEQIKIYSFVGELLINDQAEDGDRRPWITFVTVNFSLKSITPVITYARRKRDSDDVKIIIDGKTQGNLFRSIKHFLWRYAGSLLPNFFPKTETEIFNTNLSQGTHYVEFFADRMPILNSLSLDLGENLPAGPTKDNPKWTGNFADDSEIILLTRLIFGEAEDQPIEAKTGVGFTVINRVKKQRSNWGLTVKEVILKESQYDAFGNPDRRKIIEDPLENASEATKQAWDGSYKVAGGILDKSLADPTNGATNFHSFINQKDFPAWATEENFKVKLGSLYFYELEN